MILYIHGFASSANSKKVTILKKRLDDVIAFNLSPEPKIAIEQLETFIKKYQNQSQITLIGSSLGGFYAMYLSKKYNLKTILINPAIKPWNTLLQYENYSTNEVFNFKTEFLKQLYSYQIDNLGNSNILLLLQTGDVTLDYRDALEFLPNVRSITETGGSHQFDKFEIYLDIINEFTIS